MTERLIGNYRIIDDLGAGGMASVHLAVHRDVPNLKVVLKKLNDRRLVDRFKREADKLALLGGQPGICQIRHFFDHADDFYIAMEYIDGRNLGQLIEAEGGLGRERALEIMLAVLHALDFAHRQGIYHRDIKPTNIMVDKDGLVKIIDFGLAKGKFDTDLTSVGTQLGSPRYMPPEQYSPVKNTEWSRCDVYAVGGTLYHALTGCPPFKATEYFELREEKLRGRIAPPSSINPMLSRELDAVILRAQAVDPADRYVDAAEMLVDLKSATDCNIPAATASPPEQDLERTYEGPPEESPAASKPPIPPVPVSGALPETVPVSESPPESMPSPPPESTTQPSSGGRWPRKMMLVATCALVLILVAVGIWWITNRDDGEELNDDAVKSGIIGPTTRVTNSLGMELVLIPDGAFLRGSSLRELMRKSDEEQHRVTISRPFYMSTTEVTQEQWFSVMEDNPSHFRECGGNCPVDSVDWFDAIRFCNLLSEVEGLSPVYVQDGGDVTWTRDAKGYRLPTEAEWEYACRAGTETAFHTGDCLVTDQANYHGEYPYEGCKEGLTRGKTTRAGSYAANDYGLVDMHGNVWEWCWDWYGDYPVEAMATDPSGPAAGDRRILRGGAWSRHAEHCRSANRTGQYPGYRRDCDGLRVVLDCKDNDSEAADKDTPDLGTVVVTIDPAGGTLYVDDRLVDSDLDGRTMEVAPGAHIVRVEHPGSIEGSQERHIDVRGGGSQDLTFAFTLKPIPEYGTIRVGSSPGWGYDIYIDGILHTKTTNAQLTLAAGKHVIKVAAVVDGVAREQTREITIVPGDNGKQFFILD